MDLIGFCHFYSISFFTVQFVTDKVGIIEIPRFFQREDFFCHFFAGTAPTGVIVNENQFVFLFSHC